MSIKIRGAVEFNQLLKSASFKYCGNEVHCFHPQFVSLIDAYCESIYLDYLDSFEEFPESQGIYFCVRLTVFKDPEVWYVGKAGNFRNRWKNHHKFEALKAIQDVVVFCLPLDGYSKDEIATAERIYIEMLKPVFNDTSKPEKHLRVAS